MVKIGIYPQDWAGEALQLAANKWGGQQGYGNHEHNSHRFYARA
jgi:hypothetical protein